MSQENVDLARRMYKAAAVEGIDAMLGYANDDAVWISDPRVVGGGTYRGKHAVREYLMELAVFEEETIEIHEIIDLGDRVLGIATFRATARDGLSVEWLWCHLISVEDGLVTEWRSYMDRDSALKAVGLKQ
jgi:ketosteroid isomerase-like protein